MTAPVVDRLLSRGVLPGARTGRVCPVKLDTTALPGGSIVMLLFVNDEPEPSFVVRTPRTPGHPQRILRNFESLRFLAQLRAVSRLVPRPVYCGELDGEMTSVESCMPGLPLAVPMRIARVERRLADAAYLFGIAALWLWRLHCQTSSLRISEGSLRNRETSLGRSICALHDEGFISASQKRSLFEALRIAAGQAMPVARVHGDFNPNNVLVDRRNGLSVIDWEFSGPGWSLWDLFTLARTAWFHPAANMDPSASMAQEMWDPRHPLGRALAVALARYEAASGIRREQCRLLFGLYMAEYVTEQLGLPPRHMSEPWRALLQAALEY